jgi:hypothetical protein
MRNYDQLTPTEQGRAVEVCTNQLLTAIAEGAIRFNDDLNGGNLQRRIDLAVKAAEDNRTPWFVGEFIMETCKDDLRTMAEADAQSASYPDPGEQVVRL